MALLEQETMDHLIGYSLTWCPIDRERALAVRAYGKAKGCEALALRTIYQHRRLWLDYLCRTQRHWQQETRRPSRARHHDSIAIREKYVRCHT